METKERTRTLQRIRRGREEETTDQRGCRVCRTEHKETKPAKKATVPCPLCGGEIGDDRYEWGWKPPPCWGLYKGESRKTAMEEWEWKRCYTPHYFAEDGTYMPHLTEEYFNKYTRREFPHSTPYLRGEGERYERMYHDQQTCEKTLDTLERKRRLTIKSIIQDTNAAKQRLQLARIFEEQDGLYSLGDVLPKCIEYLKTNQQKTRKTVQECTGIDSRGWTGEATHTDAQRESLHHLDRTHRRPGKGRDHKHKPTQTTLGKKQKSIYELQRDERIERNRAMLVELGITNTLLNHCTITPTKRTTKRRKEGKERRIGRRQSERIKENKGEEKTVKRKLRPQIEKETKDQKPPKREEQNVKEERSK